MERFCKDLKEHSARIINYEKKEMTPVTNEENKSHKEQKICYICIKEFSNDDDHKKYHKFRNHCHYTGKFIGAAHNICNPRYKTPNEISIVFYNGSTYDCHFIIKQLAKEFNGQLDCLGENTEKYISFSVPVKKELDNGKTIAYKLKFIDSFRLSQPHYHVLLIIYLKFTAKNVVANLCVILLGLEMVNYITNVKNVKKDR